VNLSLNINISKINDLYDQIFDYFHLTIYDLETNFDSSSTLKEFKNKFDTFSDKHFRGALNDFNKEISNLKNLFPNELFKIEKLTEEIKKNFNNYIDQKIFDQQTIANLKFNLNQQLKKIQNF
tara:strand:- start:330 stop:698 length:369 start_codon:yes stop_codon:yes gene_type:complete